MQLTSRPQPKGFSLVELMVGLLAGLIVIAAASSLYVAIVRANATTVQLSALNINMQSLLDVMERDIRRAGYFASAAQNLARNSDGSPTIAPSDRTAMFRLNNASGALQDMQRQVVAAPLYDCILLRYDNNVDGTISGNDEIMGYRFTSSTKGLEYRQWTSVATQLSDLCADNSAWQSISQDGRTVITAMTLTISPSGGVALPAGQRAITLTLAGHSQSKPALALTLQRQVRLRNDQY